MSTNNTFCRLCGGIKTIVPCPVCGGVLLSAPLSEPLKSLVGRIFNTPRIPADPPVPEPLEEEIKNLGVMGIRRTRNLAYKLVSHISDLQAQLTAKERESFLEREAVLELAARAESAEAFKQRVIEWGRGRCECCGNRVAPFDLCDECIYVPSPGTNDKDNWTPPKAWDGE